jgi:hypothetical protein
MEPMSLRRASWIAHVKSWRDSDLTPADYCRRHAFNSKTMAALLLRRASGWQLALPAGVDAAWLAGLLRGLV